MLPLRRARRADAPERRRDAAVVGRRRRRVAQVALGLLEAVQRLERARGAEVRLGVARVRLGRVLEGEVRVAGPEGRGGVAAGQAGLCVCTRRVDSRAARVDGVEGMSTPSR